MLMAVYAESWEGRFDRSYHGLEMCLAHRRAPQTNRTLQSRSRLVSKKNRVDQLQTQRLAQGANSQRPS
jgi:hypothetical protein